MKNWKFVFITILFSLILLFVCGEILSRIVFYDTYINFTTDEKNRLYRYDDTLGWFPIASDNQKYCGSHEISTKHNSNGFRDIKHPSNAKKTIAFIGDSFVWGYDVEQDQRFTDLIRQKLPNWRVLNLGVNAYGSDQELLLLRKWFSQFNPDIVFLVFSESDCDNNRTNLIGGGYHKPYMIVENDSLITKGVPVPKSLSHFYGDHPYLTRSRFIQFLAKLILPKKIEIPDVTLRILFEMNDFVVHNDARFMVGFESDKDMKVYSVALRKRGIPITLLNSEQIYPTNGGHWTPQGHIEISGKLKMFFDKEGVVFSD